MKVKLDAVFDATKKREEEGNEKGKKVAEEDVVSSLDPLLNEEPFLKSIKALGGKYFEGVPLFSVNLDIDVVMDWIDGMENHFECEGVLEA